MMLLSAKRLFLRWLAFGFACALSCSTLPGAGLRQGAQLSAGQPSRGLDTSLLQFTSGGHILGFRPGAMYLAGGDHAVKVEFVAARPVQPSEDHRGPAGAQTERIQARPLGRVTYENLWDGITLAYERKGTGVAKSTYQVAARANVEQIRLRYSVPVRLESDGSLALSLETGELRESAPVAWQEIEGRRFAIKVGFHKLSNDEVGFRVGSHDLNHDLTIDPTLTWNTFLGASSSDDGGWGIALDSNGNVYVMGWSYAPWGTPLRAFAGGQDAFVAKLNGSGALQWNTFLGSSAEDWGSGIALDSNGNVYVTGSSEATWGTPLRAHSGGGDAFVAKLNSSGALQWNTFLGSSAYDEGNAIALDPNGNVCVTGDSEAAWGTPLRAFAGGRDAFVAKLNGSGALQWNTFLGCSDDDWADGIALDSNGNVHVTGSSAATWGAPLRAYSGNSDAFVAKLDSGGALQWNTFLGCSGNDWGNGIALDPNGNVYVSGWSYAAWGVPLRVYSGDSDAFVAKLDRGGALQWNTFLGSSDYDGGSGIALDPSGNVYVSGLSTATWGTPLRAYSGGDDIFVAKLNGSGALQWNTFLGSSSDDWGNGIAVDPNGNVYVTGCSGATWGEPIRAHSGDIDAFVAQLLNPVVWPPGPANLISPSGSISTTTPTYTWSAVASATHYYLWVNDSTTAAGKIKTWYTAAQAACASGTGTCSVTPSIALAAGACQWWIQTWNDAGYGPWSDGMVFTTGGGVPPKATLVSPAGSISTTTPTYTWNAVSSATWYLLWVNDASAAPKILQWYRAAQAGCASGTGTCSVTPSIALAAGACQWWIQTWNDAGYGPWSDAMNCTVAGPPGAAILISPSGSISTTTPTYTWNAVSSATWYLLWVNDTSAAPKILQWYRAGQAGCASGTGTCSVTPSTALAAGACQWWIQTWNDSGYGPWSDGMVFTTLK